MTKLWQRVLAKERALARRTMTAQVTDILMLLEYAALGARRLP